MASEIRAVSYYLPEKIYSNEEFFTEFPEAIGSNLEKVGVLKRHIIGPEQAASDLAYLAAEKLFEEHNINRSIIDLLIIGLLDPDYYIPSTSSVMHGRLGLKKNCAAFDFAMGCSAYAYGLAMADGMMRSTGAKNVLLLTQSALTKTIHKKDKSSRFVFGDAGSATLICASEKESIGPFVLGTDGNGYEKIIIEDGGARNPINQESHKEIIDEYGNVTTRANFRMDGVGVFLFTMRTVPQLVKDLLDKAGMKQEEIDLFIFHQANQFINEKLRTKMNIPQEKFVHCMEQTGNTVQATIPIAIYEMQKNGRLKPGMKVLLAGFGVGLSWSATIVRF